jgi:hypothetical protein
MLIQRLNNVIARYLVMSTGQINSTILLNVSVAATECQYDFIYVYAGDDLSSPLLATLTGQPERAPNWLLSTFNTSVSFLSSLLTSASR